MDENERRWRRERGVGVKQRVTTVVGSCRHPTGAARSRCPAVSTVELGVEATQSSRGLPVPCACITMSPKYKLTYFNIRGLAESIRFLFVYGNVDFEDNRIEQEDWPDVKSSYPNGKLPILEFDGKIVPESSAICRYVAKQVGLAGANDWEALEIDSVADTITDVRTHIVQYAFETDQTAKAKKKETLEKETLPAYLSRLELQAKENGGYFVGGKLTWADMYLAAIHETFTHFLGSNPIASYPSLQGVVEKVYALPAIKTWLVKRPKTDR